MIKSSSARARPPGVTFSKTYQLGKFGQLPFSLCLSLLVPLGIVNMPTDNVVLKFRDVKFKVLTTELAQITQQMLAIKKLKASETPPIYKIDEHILFSCFNTRNIDVASERI